MRADQLASLREHQRDRICLVDPGLLRFRQLAERRADAIEQRLSANSLRPAFENAPLDALRLVIVERVRDPVRVEPGPRVNAEPRVRYNTVI